MPDKELKVIQDLIFVSITKLSPEAQVEWFGEDFDPEAFDLVKTNKAFARKKGARQKLRK